MENIATTLLSFLVAYPVVLGAILAALGLFTWWQSAAKRKWQERANDYQSALQHTQGEFHEAREANRQVAAEKESYRKQLACWLKPGNCLDQQWVLTGVERVRKSSGYEHDKTAELRQKSLGQEGNVFEPVPALPIKLLATETDYEPALVLTKNVGEDKFKVIVIRPTDVDKFLGEGNVLCNQYLLAELDVYSTVSRTGWGFYIPRSMEGTGALSLAMDYMLARAKVEEVPVIEDTLIHIEWEDERIRLYNFYVRKYGFIYRAGTADNPNGYITKKME